MNYLFNNPYPAGALSMAELQSNPHVIKYMIKTPVQRNTPLSGAKPPPLPVNPDPVPKSNRKWVIPTIIALLTAGVLIVGYSNSTQNKDDLESRKI